MSEGYVEMSATCFIEACLDPDWFGWRWPNRQVAKLDPSIRKHFFESNEWVPSLIERIQSGQKFVFGDERLLPETKQLSKTAKEFFYQGVDIYPYENCWFEWEESMEDNYGEIHEHFARHVCVIKANPLEIQFQYLGSGGSTREELSDWYHSGWVMSLWWSGEVSWWSYESEPSGSDNILSHQYGPHWIGPRPCDFLAMERSLAYMAMMLARETKTVERHPPAGLNAHRVKKGKVPFFSHHVVTIDPQRIVYEGGDRSQPGGPKRTSPRLHWRRGHVRTLSSGKKIGIPPSIIGAKGGGGGPGVIDKTYRVKTSQGEETRC